MLFERQDMEKKKVVKMLDRDVSWMYFNRRILQEAQRENVPLLERLTFLGIYSNNLDFIGFGFRPSNG